jgi:hypothetical protein
MIASQMNRYKIHQVVHLTYNCKLNINKAIFEYHKEGKGERAIQYNGGF